MSSSDSNVHDPKMVETQEFSELHSSDARLAMNWPLPKKILASAVAFFYTWTLLFSLTCYAAAIMPYSKAYGVSMEYATLGFSLFLFGIMFAPLFTPHVSERVGRQAVYLVATVIMSAFLLGAAFSKSTVAFLVCRFFAGFSGGPIVVNIEGSFADIWDAKHTVTYYAFIAAAQYLGASVGPIICGGVVAENGWRWSQYIPLMAALASLLFGIGASETYPRQIARNIARANGTRAQLTPALTGTRVTTMAKLTLLDPVVMFVSEPIVTLSGLTLGINFGLLFSLFTTVPAVLMMTYNLKPYTLGLGFLSGLAGSLMAIISSVIIDEIARPLHYKAFGQMRRGVVAIEHRLITGIWGSLLMVAGLFWIGNTASPSFIPTVPIAGTAVYVWGSASVIISVVGYFFDAYPRPQAVLSALTSMAVLRLFCAGIVSLFFLQGVMGITGKWMFQIFGILQCVSTVWLVGLYFLGPLLRSKSRFAKGDDGMNMSPMTMEATEDVKEEHGPNGNDRV